MPIPAIILAAGASRRLGHPKQLVFVQGETLLARTMRVAREAGADPILVVLGGHRTSIEAAVDFAHADRVLNADWEQGIATSIRAGVKALEGRCPEADAAIILACDQPSLTTGHLRALIEARIAESAQGIVASRYKEVNGIPAIFPATFFAELRALKGDIGAKHLLRSHGDNLTTINFVGGEFDIDSPKDMAILRDRFPQGPA